VLARALVGDPTLLLADEPTGNLDYKTGEAIISLLGEMHRWHGLTSVIVTHNLDYARRYGRVLKLDKGTLSPSTGSAGP
jgi:lipoprotein-releasing system ATP-binding protein